MLPPRQTDKVMENKQLIDNVEKNIHWTWRDPAAWEYDKTDLTDDVAWNDLDISAIVGAKKMLVSFLVVVRDGVAGSYVLIKTKGQTNSINRGTVYTQVNNVLNAAMFDVETDASGIIEIQCVPKPTDWTDIVIAIRGYKEA